MGGQYFAYILAAYGVSALVLCALGLWIWLDARAASRALAAMEAQLGRRERPGKPRR